MPPLPWICARWLPLLLVILISPFFSNSSRAFETGLSGAESGPYVSVRLLPERTQAQGGERITIGIEQRIADGWHTYWVNAGDSGAPPRITWSGLDGLRGGAIAWPAPKRMPMGPLVNFGYEKRVVLLQDLTLPESLPAGPVTITATVDVLVCKDICIPESHSAQFTLNGDEEGVPEAVMAAQKNLPQPLDGIVEIREQEDTLYVTVPQPLPDDAQNIALFPETWGLIENAEETKIFPAQEGDKTTLIHPRGTRPLSEVGSTVRFVITYEQGGEKQSISFAASNPAAKETGEGGGTQAGKAQPLGFLTAIMFALFGGVILNLMPCVFPVLSLKALSLVKLSNTEQVKARLNGLAYTGGILLCFGLIAGLLIALKAAGAQIGWGFQLQNPAVILALGYLFIVIALNLAGVFEFNLPVGGWTGRLAQKDGLWGSFFTGILATLVATPCTAPFMGAAMGYALTQPPLAAMAVFLALGLGLALPYLALTFIPPLRRVLPKPGAWMERFRQFLAFPMVGAALFLFWVLMQQVNAMGMGVALAGALALVFALWLLQHLPRDGGLRLFILLVMVLSFSYAGAAVWMQNGSAQEISQEIAPADNTTSFSENALEQALETESPVFVNMTAAWCISCKVNERLAIDTSFTQALFEKHGVVYLKGDWTNQDPVITKFLESYGRNGVPLYVLYGRPDENGLRPEAVVLPQILTPKIFETLLDKNNP